MGIAYLAAVLRDNGHEPIVLDMAVKNIKNEEISKYIKVIKPHIIGISAVTLYYNGMKTISNLIKKTFPDIPIILGGVHVSALPKISLRNCNADLVVIGEGEKTIIEIMEYYQNHSNINSLKNIDGICYKSGKEIIITEPRAPIKDLDTLPYPAWDLIDIESYPAEPHSFLYKKSPLIPLLATRGCVYQCSYCASAKFWQKGMRIRSVQKIVDEIEYMIEHYGAKEIHFWDDNFTFSKRFVFEFCKEILSRKIKIHLDIPNGIRIDTIDELVLKFMKSAGFYSITYAIESGSQQILNNVKKHLDLNKIEEPIRLSHRLGFTNRSFFIMGLPGETYENIWKSINLSKKLKLDTTNFFIAQPLPCSELFDIWVRKQNIDINKINWADINFFTNMKGNVFSNIPNEKLKKFQIRAYIEFYLMQPWHLLSYGLYLKKSQIKTWIKRIIILLFSGTISNKSKR